LATLRVLGFHYEEIHKLVLVENYFSVVLGIVLGTPVGRFMSWVITSTLDDNMDLTGNLVLPDVLITVITTLCFAWLINRVVAKKMQEIDMLEALKSVE
jgi:putative ABC transport system permease protein